ncbi:MAG TPA: hypothetical protein VEQ42_02195, partial [Pyrinomonadaceae bacterium]|nr:hypothetical protein [Pyrinomonadaceae bacterium]
ETQARLEDDVKNFYAGRVGVAALICASSFLLMVSAEPSFAQRGSPGATAAGRRVDTLTRQGEQYERDNLGREREAPADAPRDRRRAKDAAEQVKRDFDGLQAAYNKIVLAMAPGKRPDLDSILDSVVEVKRCASRLRDHLALPKAGDDEADEARGEARAARLEESLLMLRKHIYSFVTNPLFDGPPVLDVQQAAKARRDLDKILELSESIRRSGDRPEARQD